MEYLRRVRRHARNALNKVSSSLAGLLRRAQAWWHWHWTRIAEERGYAEALVAVLLEAVELLTLNMRARYLAHELLAVYVTVLRALRRPRLGDDPV